MIEKLKGMLKSKTIWFALALAVFGAVQANLELLQPVLGPKAYGLFTVFVAVAVVVLRWVTTTALDEK
jgi:lysozyme family protein